MDGVAVSLFWMRHGTRLLWVATREEEYQVLIGVAICSWLNSRRSNMDNPSLIRAGSVCDRKMRFKAAMCHCAASAPSAARTREQGVVASSGRIPVSTSMCSSQCAFCVRGCVDRQPFGF